MGQLAELAANGGDWQAQPLDQQRPRYNGDQEHGPLWFPDPATNDDRERDHGDEKSSRNAQAGTG